ncbi:histidyl-tRNA synthetase [Chlamydia trachomatis]|nr:histidyl-tRNA synthetase [Chlamydia trachomatis]
MYETELVDYPEIGSVCSGGRYENLASYYTDRKLPGVGLSIGLSRLFYQLNQAKIIGAKKESLTDVMVIPMDNYEMDSIKLAAKLQEAGIATTVYTEKAKLGKKFKYADSLNIPYTIVVGENEVKTGEYAIKDMAKQEQESLTVEQIIARLK